MYRSLRTPLEHLHHGFTSAATQPLARGYGQLLHRHRYAAALDPPDAERLMPPRRQVRRIHGQQHSAKLFDGSALSLSHLLHSAPHYPLRRSHCEISCPLPRSHSLLPVLQETLLGFSSRAFHCSSVCSTRGDCFDRNFRVFSSALLLPNNYPRVKTLDFVSRCFSGIHCSGVDFDKSVNFNYRGFSSVSNDDSDSDAEVEFDYGGEDRDEDENGCEDVCTKSGADPEEVDRVCKIIEELFALDRNMEAVLDGCEVNLSHDLMVEVLERFRHARKPAFRFFNWAGQKRGFSHDSRTYNKMMTILGKTRQFETMVALLEEMGEKGLLTLETFTIAIKAFAAAKERKKAVGIFELMKRYNFRAGNDTINCLLDNLGRAKLGKEAQALFGKLKDRFTPDLHTYSVLLNGWCRLKNLMEVGKIWNEMIDSGIKPDVAAHNMMLEGLLRCKRRSDAIKLLEVMKAKGPYPNVRTYTILIRDFCKHTKMKEAVEYLDEMLDYGCRPDAAIYTCLITGFGNQKKMDKVFGLLKEMKEKGCPPDGRTYNALIKLMANRRMPDDAVRVYKKMIESGIQPTIHTYNMMMKSYFQTRNYEMGCAVWEEMGRKGCCPDDNSYIVFIGGLIRQGRSEEACKYLEEMIEKGMKAPLLDYDKFAADFSRAGNPEILEELAQKMKFSGKFEASDFFTRCADSMKKTAKRRGFVRPEMRICRVNY